MWKKTGRYRLKPKVYNKFMTMNYTLICKICGFDDEMNILYKEDGTPVGALKIGDTIESKTGGEGPKLYHAECYDRSHLDFGENGTILDGYGDPVGEKKDE